MKELTNPEEQLFTIKELSKLLSVSVELITKTIRKIYPDKMEKGKATYLNETEVTEIKYDILDNKHLVQSYEVRNIKTSLEEESQLKDLKPFIEERGLVIMNKEEVVKLANSSSDDRLDRIENTVDKLIDAVADLSAIAISSVSTQKQLPQSSQSPVRKSLTKAELLISIKEKIIKFAYSRQVNSIMLTRKWLAEFDKLTQNTLGIDTDDIVRSFKNINKTKRMTVRFLDFINEKIN